MEDRGRPAGAWAVVPGGGEVVQKERVLHVRGRTSAEASSLWGGHGPLSPALAPAF